MGNSHQPLTMGNSPQLSTMDKLSVTYQYGTLQTDISNLQTFEVESLEINWSDTSSQKDWSDTSSQEEYTRCRVEISRFLKSPKFPKVERLVLNNLFYSEELLYDLTRKFLNIEHLKILPFNTSRCSPDFCLFSALSELEIALGFSDSTALFPPTQLKELTLNISKVASEGVMSAMPQWSYLNSCISLESL